jgi:hypothetical protein
MIVNKFYQEKIIHQFDHLKTNILMKATLKYHAISELKKFIGYEIKRQNQALKQEKHIRLEIISYAPN